MIKIHPLESHPFASLFAPLDIHLPVFAMLAGEVAGDVLADDDANPSAALLRCNSRFYLAGDPLNTQFNQRLCEVFSQIYAGEIPGLDEFSICFSAGWGPVLEEILKDHLPLSVQRQYYEIDAHPTDWQRDAFPGITLRLADQELLARPLEDLDNLREEMCSERASVDEFLQKSFGLCPVTEENLVGWCLSEYNLAERCEIGIAILPTYQRRGIAAWMTRAFVDEACRRGITRVGWHCYASNIPSGATALKAGFHKVADYPAIIGIIDPLINLGAHGNTHFWQGQYENALIWYRQALQSTEAPAWIYWNAACSAARCGLHEEALHLLHGALDGGFEDAERLSTSPHFESLRGLPGWDALVQRI